MYFWVLEKEENEIKEVILWMLVVLVGVSVLFYYFYNSDVSEKNYYLWVILTGNR